MTLSIEQKALAEERIKEAGLEDRIRVHLMDYRDLPAEFEKAFDAFISIEMIEVGLVSSNSNTVLIGNGLCLACRLQVLQSLLQTGRLGPETPRRHRRRHFINISRISVHRLPVRVPSSSTLCRAGFLRF